MMGSDYVCSDKEMADLEEKLFRFKKSIPKSSSRTACTISLDEKNKPYIELSFSKSAPEAEVKNDSIPEKFEGLPVVINTRDFSPQASSMQLAGTQISPSRENFSTSTRHNVLRPGISISHPSVTAGTLGAFVIDKTNNKVSILSNWHVLVGADGRSGDGIIQPGSLDGGTPNRDKVADLERWILDADGDAAIATLNGARPWLPAIYISNSVPQNSRKVRLGEVVEKVGRTTQLTHGKVKKFGNYTIAYDVGPRTISGFEVVPIEEDNPSDIEVSEGGDSGSIWYSSVTNDAVGLHFAGETTSDPKSEHAIACHLPRVLERLQCRLATQVELMELIVSYSGNQQENRSMNGSDFFNPFVSSVGGRYDTWNARGPFPNPRPWDESWGASWGAMRSEGNASSISQYTELIYILKTSGVSPWELEALGLRLGLQGQSDLLPNQSIRKLAPELGPAAWAAIGFAGGAVARLVGRESAHEFLPAAIIGAKAAAFLVGAVVGSRAVDGKL